MIKRRNGNRIAFYVFIVRIYFKYIITINIFYDTCIFVIKSKCSRIPFIEIFNSRLYCLCVCGK